MDPDRALELVKSGSTLLLLDVPQYTLIGVDTQVFFTEARFKGIKMIPPGVHFVYYSSSTRDGKESSPITGFFIETSCSEVVVRKWNAQEERLIRVSEEEEGRYSQAVKDMQFDQELGPYKLSDHGDWKRLSGHITKEVIDRLEPIGGEITVACESKLINSSPETAIERKLSEQLKNSKFSKPIDKIERKGCYYTQIPRVVKQRGIGGSDLTSMNLDKTHLLESILMKEYGCDEDKLLGELQFAFVAFLMGQSLEGFLQWKSLVSLLLGCTEAPFHTRSKLFAKFMAVLYYQIKYGFQDPEKNGRLKDTILLDDSWFSGDSFLYQLCKDLFSLVDEASVIDGDLLTWTRKFRGLVENIFGWNFNQQNTVSDLQHEADDEYAPVVVAMDHF